MSGEMVLFFGGAGDSTVEHVFARIGLGTRHQACDMARFVSAQGLEGLKIRPPLQHFFVE